MGSGSGTKTKTEQIFMPGQLGFMGQSAGEWAEQMRNWQPFFDISAMPKYGGPSEHYQRELGGLAAMGGFSPEEQMARAGMMKSMQEGFFDPEAMMKASQDYATAAKAKASDDLTEAQRVLDQRYGARGKYGSGGHLKALSDLYTGFGESMGTMEAAMSQQALQEARAGELGEAQELQKMADFGGQVFGGMGTVNRLGQLSAMGGMPREQQLAELSQQFGLHTGNLQDLMNMLGRGVGIATTSLPMEGTSRSFGGKVQYSGQGAGKSGGGGGGGMGINNMGAQAMMSPYGGISYPTYSGLGGYGWGGSYGMPNLSYYGYGF